MSNAHKYRDRRPKVRYDADNELANLYTLPAFVAYQKRVERLIARAGESLTLREVSLRLGEEKPHDWLYDALNNSPKIAPSGVGRVLYSKAGPVRVIPPPIPHGQNLNIKASDLPRKTRTPL